MYIFTDSVIDTEAIFVFVPNIKTRISIASNCEYEVWDQGTFIGMGGRRCPKGEAYLNIWTGKSLKIRLHWINPEKNRIWYRSLFVTPFLYCDEDAITWKCYHEISTKFSAKACNQLARQNIIDTNNYIRVPTNIKNINWNIIPDPVFLMDHIPVTPTYISSGRVKSRIAASSLYSDVLQYIRSERLKYDTYDLGYIALHKFLLPKGLYCYTQTRSPEDEWQTSNQKKVRLADAIIGSQGSPIGYRGCRYLHVFYSDTSVQFTGKVWRAQYPFKFKDIPENNIILNACRNTLIACVDGGFTDTCWRERAQWTGDARMMAKAIKTLTYNDELIPFVLGQLAKSYDNSTGMVDGAYPAITPDHKMPMPSYHLAFCLSVYENNIEELKPLVLESINLWKKRYLKNGLISHLPGWIFIDWDFTDESVIGSNNNNNALPNCVINSWWYELCAMADTSSDMSIDMFMHKFYKKSGYSLYPDGEANIHATACVITSGLDFNNIKLVVPKIALKSKITTYFGYFVAKALTGSQRLTFINDCYLPSAKRFGTIWEKHDDKSSIAHGWSVAVAELLI